MNKHLEINNICVDFPSFSLKPISFSLERGKMLVFLGQSGSGKSTIIRAISGLQEFQDGDVLLNGRSIKNIPVHKRNIGMVFQDLALFPHLTVFENIAFGLKIRGWELVNIKKRVEILLKAMHMQGYEKRAIDKLSGGEKQRVALARTLAPEPELILFDEPLSALDAKLRKELRQLIRDVQQRLGFSAIYVTHDQEEAFDLADELAVMQDGNLLQIGSADNIYLNPANTYVAKLLGISNIFEGEIISEKPGIFIVKTDDIELNVPSKEGYEIGDLIFFGIRPEAGILSREDFGLNVISTRISEEKTLAGRKEWIVSFSDKEMLIRSNRHFWTKDVSTKDSFLHIPLEGISILEKKEKL